MHLCAFHILHVLGKKTEYIKHTVTACLPLTSLITWSYGTSNWPYSMTAIIDLFCLHNQCYYKVSITVSWSNQCLRNGAVQPNKVDFQKTRPNNSVLHGHNHLLEIKFYASRLLQIRKYGQSIFKKKKKKHFIFCSYKIKSITLRYYLDPQE